MQSVEYSPLIRGLVLAAVRPAGPLLPMCRNASLLVVPDISGYIGADTIGCVLSTGLYESEETVLLVDIGTNGEMVLGGKDRMIACAAAADQHWKAPASASGCAVRRALSIMYGWS